MLQRTNVYLPKQELLLAKEVAASENTTVSKIVRRGLHKELTQNGTNWASSLLALVKKAKKPKKLGPTDLSKNHDYYLGLILEEKLERGRRVVKKWEQRERNKKKKHA